MYIITILTTKRNGVDLTEITEMEIDGFEWRKTEKGEKFLFHKWCKANELEDDKYNKEYLIGLRAKQ